MIDDWRFEPDGFGPAVAGFTTTYRAGRQALEILCPESDPDAFHEYRKQVKYAWYQLRLLESMAPSMLTPARTVAGALGDALGQVNDLAVVMATWLDDDPEGFGGSDQAGRAGQLIGNLRADFQQQATGIGLRFHAEEPHALADRIERYWVLWREHGPEQRDRAVGSGSSRALIGLAQGAPPSVRR